MSDTKLHEYILRAISSITGDDLERATAAFRNCSPEQMNQVYGQSGKTRQEILDGYKAERELNRRAVEYVRSLTALTPKQEAAEELDAALETIVVPLQIQFDFHQRTCEHSGVNITESKAYQTAKERLELALGALAKAGRA